MGEMNYIEALTVAREMETDQKEVRKLARELKGMFLVDMDEVDASYGVTCMEEALEKLRKTMNRINFTEEIQIIYSLEDRVLVMDDLNMIMKDCKKAIAEI